MKIFIILFSVFIYGHSIHAKEIVYSNYNQDLLEWSSVPIKNKCPDIEGYLWIEDDDDDEIGCIRYYSSGNLKNTDVAVIGFYGDRDIDVRKSIYNIKNNTESAQKNYAKKQFKLLGIPYLVMARPGTYGSTGLHKNKRYISEFLLINNAIDILKKRYKIKKFILIGNSGGATIGAALLTLGRSDIKCAVLISGTYNYLAREALRRKGIGIDYTFNRSPKRIVEKYDPIYYIDNIVKDKDRKIFIIGNDKDKITPFHLQVAFAWRLSGAGHNVEIIQAKAYPPSYHNVYNANSYIKMCN